MGGMAPNKRNKTRPKTKSKRDKLATASKGVVAKGQGGIEKGECDEKLTCK